MKKVLIITDNKPGHESISDGIIEYLKKYDEFEIIKLSVILRFGFFKFILKILLGKQFFLDRLTISIIRIFYKFSNDDINYTDMDLIISSGGNTSFANAMFSKIYHTPNVLCTYLRGLDNNLFDYVLTVSGNDKYHNSLTFDLLPVKVAKDDVKISEFRKKLSLKDNHVWSILIGGPNKEYPFTDEEILLFTKKILDKAKDESADVLFTTSRRTGLKLENKLSRLISQYDNVIYSVLYNTKPEKIISVYLYNSDVVFVTEDSGSMVTESIYAQKPTITLTSKNRTKHKEYKYDRYIANLENKNYIKRCRVDDIEKLILDKINFQFYNPTKNEENFHKIYNLMKERT